MNSNQCYRPLPALTEDGTAVPPTRRQPIGEGLLPDASAHSESFRQTRKARRNALVEDYVELIADLIEDGGEARQVDIASRLGVAQPTVAKMLRRLAAEGFAVQRPYRGVFLTEAGARVARESRERHQTVETFLRALGVSAHIARIDAEGIEHHVSEETLEALRRYLRKASPKSSHAKSWGAR